VDPARKMPLPSFFQRIIIKHPGYGGNNNILKLPAYDGDETQGRAHYSTIHAACAIIANNRTDGWLSISSSGEPRVEADANGLIPAGAYFFHVDGGSEPYPVVPNFRSWVFPHENMPSLWLEAAQNTSSPELGAVLETCRLTDMRLACENAHIVPAAEKDWFADNHMDEYSDETTGVSGADEPANSMRLRRDIHKLWDTMLFSIVPKKQHDAEGDVVRWHAHGMVKDEELYTHYHNRPLKPLAGRAAEYFFARFAWDVFPKVISFLQSSQPRRLAVGLPNGETEVRMFSPKECTDFTVRQELLRSASPAKRSRGPDNAISIRSAGGEACSATTTKRKRQSASSERGSQVDSAISNVESPDNLEYVLAPGIASPSEYWSVKGYAFPDYLDHGQSEQSEEDERPRGRKRQRNI
jgi:hypothetical protein